MAAGVGRAELQLQKVRPEKVETGGKPVERWFPAELGAISAINPTPNIDPLNSINAINSRALRSKARSWES